MKLWKFETSQNPFYWYTFDQILKHEGKLSVCFKKQRLNKFHNRRSLEVTAPQWFLGIFKTKSKCRHQVDLKPKECIAFFISSIKVTWSINTSYTWPKKSGTVLHLLGGPHHHRHHDKPRHCNVNASVEMDQSPWVQLAPYPQFLQWLFLQAGGFQAWVVYLAKWSHWMENWPRKIKAQYFTSHIRFRSIIGNFPCVLSHIIHKSLGTKSHQISYAQAYFSMGL